MLGKVVKRCLINVTSSIKYKTSNSFVIKRYFADEPNPTETALDTKEETLEEALPSVPEKPLKTPELPTYQTKSPMELINEIPPIEVDGTFAICRGTYFNSDMSVYKGDIREIHAKIGHPAQWIQLNTRKPYTPQTCGYCGLRFVMKRRDDWDPDKEITWDGMPENC
mmetsp:Transcript_106921/g.130392  ORF Transcript_106921/g.130392 Transcript_106921/m.130392 type:complete len:167 (+) Transcript_106921:50-550(+)